MRQERKVTSDPFPMTERLLDTSNVYQATLNDFTLTFDLARGTLLKLTHPAFGTILETSQDTGGLFTVSYVAEYLPQQLEPQNSFLLRPIESGLTNDGRPILKLYWTLLHTNVTGLSTTDASVTVVVYITVPIGRPGIMMKAWVHNEKTNNIYQVHFPDLHGIRPFGGSTPQNLLLQTNRTWVNQQTVRPFLEPLIPEERTPFYAASLWKRYSLSTKTMTYGPSGEALSTEHLDPINNWMYFEACPGNRLYIYEDLQDTAAALPATEIMTMRDQSDPTSMRLIWRRPTAIRALDLNSDPRQDPTDPPIPWVPIEGQTPWVTIGPSLQTAGCP
jgi:hypothetical protein